MSGVHLVAADVGGADVEHVRALVHLLLRHVQHALGVAGQHQLAELLAAVGIRALADKKRRRAILIERHCWNEIYSDRKRIGIAEILASTILMVRSSGIWCSDRF